MQKISVVIPVYNEEGNIFEFYNRLKKVLEKDFSSFTHEILYVDDGSTDRTFDLLEKLQEKDLSLKVVQLSRNFGHYAAFSAGLDLATGDLIATMDGDLEVAPENLPKLYNKIQEGYDSVFGIRQNKTHSFLKKLSSKIFLYLVRLIVSKKVIINSETFRLMTRQVVDNVKKCKETTRYILGLISWVGFKQAGVPFNHDKRFKGETKYSFKDRCRLAMEIILAFSDYPLQMVTKCGFLFVFISGCLMVYLILIHIIYGVFPSGWTSLITAILFMGGVQIVFLGIIGKYVGGAYMEAKRRPLYIVRQILNQDKKRD